MSSRALYVLLLCVLTIVQQTWSSDLFSQWENALSFVLGFGVGLAVMLLYSAARE